MPEKSLNTQIREYISSRGLPKLEEFDKKTNKEVAKFPNSELAAKHEYEQSRARLRKAEVHKYEPANWLTNAANRASQINFVTHALKYSHVDAKGSSVMNYGFKSGTRQSNTKLVCTETLASPTFDVVGNAAALDIAGLLNLQFNGETLIQYLIDGNHSAFESFSSDSAQISDWVKGFKAVLSEQETSSHKLAKQLYFPVSDDGYHLLSPLFASSLANEIHHKIKSARYSDEAKETRKLKKEHRYSDQIAIDFVNIATQGFGGTKPQNISLLNSARVGKVFLLSAQPPPGWTTQAKPPVNDKNAFWRGLMRQRGVYRTVKELRIYLEKKEKNASTKIIRDRRADFVEDIAGQVLQYAAVIQALAGGWSDDSELPLEERLWLDPSNQDVGFQANRAKNDWQEKVANRFGAWLNNHLNQSKSLAFSDVEFGEWRDAIKRDLELLR